MISRACGNPVPLLHALLGVAVNWVLSYAVSVRGVSSVVS